MEQVTEEVAHLKVAGKQIERKRRAWHTTVPCEGTLTAF